MIRTLFILLLVISFVGFSSEGKKIKNSFRIEKSQKKEVKKDNKVGLIINLTDSLSTDESVGKKTREMKGIKFAGYDKEVGSNLESFIIVNTTKHDLTGFRVRIDYEDMQGRMLHSREVEEVCYVPKGETRRFDIKSWDLQHTFYYYLGNEPRRVATPFKVIFTPLTLWIGD